VSKRSRVEAGSGNDIINGSNEGDSDFINQNGTVVAGSLSGGEGDDTIRGNGGDDYIYTGTGNDTVDGGDGWDRVDVDHSNSTTALNLTYTNFTAAPVAGRTNLRQVEHVRVYSGSANDTINISAAPAIEVSTGGGNDRITAGRRSRIYAGSGNDIINGSNEGDSGFEIFGGGLFGEEGDDTINGNGGDDTIRGGAGDDIILGGTGNDDMAGDTGNDTYQIDNLNDIISETSTLATEIDTVESSISYLLGANLENLTLTGTRAINGTGNSRNNVITGNAANNRLSGGGDNDRLNGGAGNDTLVGSIGADQFVFTAPTQGTDTITDFAIAQNDRILASAAGFGSGLTAGASITAAQFGLGTAASTAAQRFIYDSSTGALRFDQDGTGATAAVQIATLSTKPTLTNTSITVIA
jgi:Ca2+-binding RTX toxin-like protein